MSPSARQQEVETSLHGMHSQQSAVKTPMVGDSETDDSHNDVPAPAPRAKTPQQQQIKYVCNLNIHDGGSSKEDILVNVSSFAPNLVAQGNLMRIRGIKGSSHDRYRRGNTAKGPEKSAYSALYLDEFDTEPSNSYLFRVTPMPSEMVSKHDQEVSVSSQLAAAFQLVKGSQVILTPVDRSACSASHVEIIFRDQYLARADTWRLVNAELAGECLHRGQRIVFLGSIKATITSLFIDGRKVHSAYFGPSTKPIFRSESARYVLFIQMSKEMWDFDAEGTGEIMFDKVINGFLPELFRRWQDMQAKHLLSIILFSRMVYDDQPTPNDEPATGSGTLSARGSPGSTNTKDFYRVVVSDMSSAQSANILNQLKREFKVFLRDISTRKPCPEDHTAFDSDPSEVPFNLSREVIAGHPSSAAHGNILEAINLASSQFSSDYIDRDLVRTGVNIIVISPGTGLFEVDYDLLVATTDNLVDNGVGIDLVCLSRMPLHSVPLFQYKKPRQEAKAKQKQRDRYALPKIESHQTPSPSSVSPGSYQDVSSLFQVWSFGIPHWIDVSFWTSVEEDRRQVPRKLPKSKSTSERLSGLKYKAFVPRVKMYELQMMGVMENAEKEISIPQLTFAETLSTSNLGQSTVTHGIVEPKRFQALSNSSFDDGLDLVRAPNGILSTSPRSLHSKDLSGSNVFTQRMDEYDDLVFRNPRTSRRRRAQRRVRHRFPKDIQGPVLPTSAGLRKSSLNIKQDASETIQGTVGATGGHARQTSTASVATSSTEGGGFSRKPSAMPRSISFGLKGLTPKAIATVSAKVDNTQSPIWSSRSANKSSILNTEPTHSLSSISAKQDSMASAVAGLRPPGDHDLNPILSSDSDRQDSQPIPIRSGTSFRMIDGRSPQNLPQGDGQQLALMSGITHTQGLLHNIEYDEAVQPLPPVMSPVTTLAPWLTVLNPCNPSKTKLAETSRLGRWQHIFPRAPKTSQMKWKSLCSPAAIPLTTEEFPTADEFEEEYKRESYVVTLPEEMDLAERPRPLVHELLAFRLSRGFQIVVGDRLAKVEPSAASHATNVFCENVLGELQSNLFLSRGSVIHHLTRSSLARLEVEVFTRHSVVANDKKTEEKPMLYNSLIRSMLAETFQPQVIPIAPQRGSFNWDHIDAFIAGHERPEAAQYVETLRPWRARYVLIPVDPPSTIRRSVRPSEDNEEEIRLEGIKKLTQMWQRFRFIAPERRGYQTHVRTAKDPNPLDISYQTKDPPAVIAAELESALEGDETGRPVQILPEPDLYQRSNFDRKSLAETLQGEKGVRMLDRRWHWRLHYNCFIGFELTTWLLQNFRDVETREDAEGLGKELMQNGLFKHVEQRHNFRDGVYFYQIEAEYRTPRPESKSWFGRGKSSVPPTPMTEKPPPELPKLARSRASSNAETISEVNNETHMGKRQQLSVALSKSLLYDVDHRRRSYRQELINLHYDRLHNPDNCYHIRVEWMNTTPRLIQEAITTWAATVDRYGLRLIEVPIGEVSSITSMHPFRAPFTVKLARSPPTKQPHNYFDATAFVPQPQSDQLFYQKAIMKHFNFVLDYEAVSSFPADVDVSYSWGKPDYRYPQYIHRSGTLIAQITEEGQFLLLANRLYNNRSTRTQPVHQDPPFLPSSGSHKDRPSNIYHPPPPPSREAYRTSPRSSPHSSPATRATASNVEVPSTFALDNTGSVLPPATRAIPTQDSGRLSSTVPAVNDSPEQLTRDFHSFCSSPTSLDAFYADVLSKAATPSSTPFMASVKYKTPLMTPVKKFTDTLGTEGEIPNLDLPRSVLEGEKVTSPTLLRKREERVERENMKMAMREVELKRAMGESSPGAMPR